MIATSIPHVPRHHVIGVFWIVVSVFLMALQDALVKATSSDIGLWQLFALRAVFAVPVIYLAAKALAPGENTFGALLDRWVLVRSGLLVAMYLGLYTVIPFVPLATLAAGFYTGPIFIVLFSAIASGDRVRVLDRFAILVGFIGVLMISRPTADGLSLFALVPVLSGIFYAIAAVMTREALKDKKPLDLSLSLNVSLGVVGFFMSGVVVAVDVPAVASLTHLVRGWQPLDLTDIGLIALLGVMLVLISVTLAYAYRTAPSPIIASFDYSYLIFSGLFGFLLFRETPTIFSVIGMLLIVGAGLAMLRRGPRAA